MLRVLSLKDFVIVRALEVDFTSGFSVLTGETGAGKSILIDALQLALGGRGDAIVVREGAARADIAAAFDTPASLQPWLNEAGFADEESRHTLLLRRSIDAQGRSRAWVNGVSATVTQLREAADHLVDIHGQHAWQSLTRPAAVRALVDEHGRINTSALGGAWQRWQDAQRALALATSQAGARERERERLAWQVGEVGKLGPSTDEWRELNDEHKRLSNAQALMGAAQTASDAIAEADDNAGTLVDRAADAIADVVDADPRLQPALDVLRSAQAQLSDAAHTLRGYLQHADLDPRRLATLDERLATWMSLARRFKLPPAELAQAMATWQAELAALDASTDVDALARAAKEAEKSFRDEAKRVSKARHASAPKLAQAVSDAMQQLGMAGGRFEIKLEALAEPQSFGLESAEFLVAGHAGSSPKPLAKVASGGELSRLALAIAVTTSQRAPGQDTGPAEPSAGTLIFDEIDSGVGGAVADTVGQLMRKLGQDRQVLAVTHLAQVAACADHHYVVSKGGTAAASTESRVSLIDDPARVTEVARMLGGDGLATSQAHATQMLAHAKAPATRGAIATGSAKPKRRRAS